MYKETHKAHVQKAFNEIQIDKLDLQNARMAFIINQIKRIFALQLPVSPELPITFPGSLDVLLKDIYSRIMDVHDFSVKDLVALRRTCHAFNDYIFEDKELLLKVQTMELVIAFEKFARDTSIVMPFSSVSKVAQLVEALHLYVENGDLAQELIKYNEIMIKLMSRYEEFINHQYRMITVGDLLKDAQKTDREVQEEIQNLKDGLAKKHFYATHYYEQYKEIIDLAEQISQVLKLTAPSVSSSNSVGLRSRYAD